MIAAYDRPLQDGNTVLGWNMQTYFFEDTFVQEVEPHENATIYRVHFKKWEDEDPKWERPDMRRVDVSALQPFLMDDGSERVATELKAGDRLQNFCGNGHHSEVESVEVLGPGLALELTLGPHQHYVVRGGVILKGKRGA